MSAWLDAYWPLLFALGVGGLVLTAGLALLLPIYGDDDEDLP